MKKISLFVLGTIIAVCIFSFISKENLAKPKHNFIENTKAVLVDDSAKSKIQVVFALDATGSMSGLMAAAKEKIWSIAGSFSQADPAPQIEIGLIFYRDKGDKFITKILQLNSDLDDIYERLMEVSASGGGDTPESVNQGLYEAITKFNWDVDTTTFKTIFLVGDCPPHMNYNEVKYPESCKLAKEKDIVLNTILMGNNSEAKRVWQEIANCNEGSFTNVGMNANDIQVTTPYDIQIAACSDKLDELRYYYGNKSEKELNSTRIKKSLRISSLSKASTKAQRAEYMNSKSGEKSYFGKNELVTDYKSKKIDLQKIKQEELPEEWKNISPMDLKIRLDSLVLVRDSVIAKINELSKKRQSFIESDLSKRDSATVNSSFNAIIYDKIKVQTGKKGIKMKGKAKY
jgi:hypothetical protein